MTFLRVESFSILYSIDLIKLLILERQSFVLFIRCKSPKANQTFLTRKCEKSYFQYWSYSWFKTITQTSKEFCSDSYCHSLSKKRESKWLFQNHFINYLWFLAWLSKSEWWLMTSEMQCQSQNNSKLSTSSINLYFQGLVGEPYHSFRFYNRWRHFRFF